MAAALIDCSNDDKDYVPVTVRLCAMKLARLPLQDRSQLLCFFDEIAAMVQAAERISEQPVDPCRLSLLGCTKTLCTVARTVADGGIGIGIGPNQVYGEVVFNLLLPYMPAEIESMRAQTDEARRTRAASA